MNIQVFASNQLTYGNICLSNLKHCLYSSLLYITHYSLLAMLLLTKHKHEGFLPQVVPWTHRGQKMNYFWASTLRFRGKSNAAQLYACLWEVGGNQNTHVDMKRTRKKDSWSDSRAVRLAAPLCRPITAIIFIIFKFTLMPRSSYMVFFHLQCSPCQVRHTYQYKFDLDQSSSMSLHVIRQEVQDTVNYSYRRNVKEHVVGVRNIFDCCHQGEASQTPPHYFSPHKRSYSGLTQENFNWAKFK